MAVDRSDIVRRAWVTRRKKYGPSGSKRSGRNLGNSLALRMPNPMRDGNDHTRSNRARDAKPVKPFKGTIST